MKGIFLQRLLFRSILVAVVIHCSSLQGHVSAAARSPIDDLVGEDHAYAVSFLWLVDVARGRLLLVEGERPGTYRATLEVSVRGLAAWISGVRGRRYSTLMEWGPDEGLRPLRHEVRTFRGRGEERTDQGSTYLYDYGRRSILHKSDGEEAPGELPAPPDSPGRLPSDILTAFYNMRLGVYGPLAAGRRYLLPVIAGKGVGRMVVEFLPPEERPGRFFPEGGLLGRILLDRKVFDTGGGSVYVWLDGRGVPARGLIENVIGFGDVRGRLID